MIIHPISVGLLLEEYGYDNEVIAAGFLHDVVEDTKYTLEDIKKEFGSEIASLVKSASEPDKSLSWEERKKHTIETSKNLPLRNKVVICADKINNLEDLMIKFEKNGKRIRTYTFTYRLKALCQKVGIVEKSLNKIRKTYGTILIDNGVDESLIISQMGHTDIRTTKQYYYKNRKTLQQKSKMIDQVSGL